MLGLLLPLDCSVNFGSFGIRVEVARFTSRAELGAVPGTASAFGLRLHGMVKPHEKATGLCYSHHTRSDESGLVPPPFLICWALAGAFQRHGVGGFTA